MLEVAKRFDFNEICLFITLIGPPNQFRNNGNTGNFERRPQPNNMGQGNSGNSGGNNNMGQGNSDMFSRRAGQNKFQGNDGNFGNGGGGNFNPGMNR